ncbi:sperm flagellar protein 2-like [Megalobrama amblycephala]|uniref:sperm flagellar protein 2-like n=1 Tax=Megalobrama amblycephala TaxID=75352 RepID=UPI002013DE1D|nr:sperm flagellar protein 2-like [Megalobrama amblycephala]XP_048013214.1 sperm flagellar protein 2-like [Megalobrama amblycephala]XP_048013215.1 sperm flagellar protein 2-like [Megalobrama amblycephala]
MGAKVSVVNGTPYTWYFATQDRGYERICSGGTTSYEEAKAIHRYIHIRYNNHTWNSFSYEFNTHKGDTSFILKETYDRSQIQLHCTSEGGTRYCPNYGKIEEDERNQRRQEEERRRLEQERRIQQELDRKRQIEEDEKRRQQEEERRRLERLEREQRIQQELDRESESSRLKLSRATERLREKQSFRGREQHHERTQALHQQIEDDAAAIERDEVTDVEEKFKEILLKYQITEDKEIQQYQIWDRIKTLQNELAVQYSREHNLSVWSQFTFDHAVGYSELSLTEKLTVLEASLQFILNSSTEDAKDDEDQLLGWEKKYDFLFGLVEQLHSTNPTLADHILLNVLDMISDLSPQSRDILGQMLFNRIWTPTEIMLLVCKSPGIKCDQLDSVLHTAQTYHLDCIHVLSVLTNENPLKLLQEQIKNNKDKDADTIVKELREANCPEKVLVLLKDVLRYVELELPKYQLVDLNKV